MKESKRTRDIRRGLLLAHVVLAWVVVIGSQCDWWSVFMDGTLIGHVNGRDPQAFQSRYIALAALVAFFFTSYDLVADADIQWPPLLASAFALGCAGQVTYQLVYREETLATATRYVAQAQLEAEKRRAAAVTSGVAPTSTAVAAVATPTATASKDEGLRLTVDWGLDLALFASFAMTVLSVYLTFFAKRLDDA